MCRASFGLLVAAAALFLIPEISMADPVTYAYSGNQYNTFYNGGTCPPDCSLSGSFTLASAIGDNFDGFVTPTSFNFTGGALTISNSNLLSGSFHIQTDSTGTIIGWLIDLVIQNPDGTQDLLTTVSNSPGTPTTDETVFDIVPGVSILGPIAENFNDPGTWTMTTTSPTPEPSSLLLLGTGLLGLGPFLRRRM